MAKENHTMQLLIVLAIVPLGLAFGYAMAMTEMKATADLMTAKEITAQLAVLAARRSRPWWRRLAV
jgi:hypothetical protein